MHSVISLLDATSFLRNEFIFWNVHRIMNTSGLVQSKVLSLQETQSIHDSMNIPKIEFITYEGHFLCS